MLALAPGTCHPASSAGRAALHALQFRQSTQVAEDCAHDGLRRERSRSVAGRDCNAGGWSVYAGEAPPVQEENMNRWLRGGLIVVVASAFMVLMVGVEAHHPACRYIIRPGLVIVVDWLRIDFWQHPASAFYLAMVFDAWLYGAFCWLILELVRAILSRHKARGKISN